MKINKSQVADTWITTTTPPPPFIHTAQASINTYVRHCSLQTE